MDRNSYYGGESASVNLTQVWMYPRELQYFLSCCNARDVACTQYFTNGLFSLTLGCISTPITA